MEKKKFPISETKLQKILYKTKMAMSDRNPLKDKIPFYWYIHGPYSPYLMELKEKLMSEGKISKIN